MTLNSTTLWNTRVSWDRFDEPHDKVYGSVDPQLPFNGPYQLTGPPFPADQHRQLRGYVPRDVPRTEERRHSSPAA